MQKPLKSVTLILLIASSFVLLITVSAAVDPVRVWALIIVSNTNESWQSFRWDGGCMYHLFINHIRADGLIYLSPSISDPGVNSTTTKDNVRQAINTTLANWSRSDGFPSNDVVLIYYTGHGGGYNTIEGKMDHGRYENGTGPYDEGVEISNATGSYGVDECWELGNSTLGGPPTQFYWDDELNSDLNYVNGTIVLVMQCCFGGGFIDDVSTNSSNRVTMTATNETYTSEGNWDDDGTPGAGFSEWSERFMDALHGVRARANMDSTPEDIVHFPDETVNADNNGDGAVSMKEACDWAKNHDEACPTDETPWMDDNGNQRPTYLNNSDQLDSTDGSLSSNTYLPLRDDLAVANVLPTVHYPLFQIFNGSMTNGINKTEIAMKYNATVTRMDNNNPPVTVYANITLKRTNSSNPNDSYNITTVSNQSFIPGQTRVFELVWNESSKHSLKQEPLCQFWNVSCTVDATTPALFDVNLTNNEFYKEMVEGRYLPGDCFGEGIVDILDAITVAGVFGKDNSSIGWNPCCNFNLVPDTGTGRQIIDIYDAICLAKYFGYSIFNMMQVGDRSSGGRGDKGEELLGSTALGIEPSSLEVFKDETFSVEVRVTDVVDLYGWEFKLYWNKTVLNCTSVAINVPGIWQNTTLEYGFGLDNDYNSSHGLYSKALTPSNPAPSFNGSMTLVTLTFKTLETGSTQLLLQDTKLGDSYAEPIGHTVTSGTVNAYYGRYMRSDTKNVNGLNAYLLNATRTATSTSASGAEIGRGVKFGIRVWKRGSGGTETEISLDGGTGTPAAVVTRSSGSGIQGATTSVGQMNLSSTDSIVVRVYAKGVEGSTWSQIAQFTTEQLGATSLLAKTWTVYYYTWASYNRFEDYTAWKFYWGNSSRNSRIQNLQYT